VDAVAEQVDPGRKVAVEVPVGPCLQVGPEAGPERGPGRLISGEEVAVLTLREVEELLW